MPMKFKSKRGRRGGMRKNAPRRRRNIAVTRVAQRTFADKMLVKLPYVDLETYTSIGGIWYNQKGYRVNALYDPEASLGNDSALGFTQYMNIYSKYRVYRVDYDITLTNANNQTAVAGAISFELPTGFSFSGDPSDLIVPYSKKFSLATGGSALQQKLQETEKERDELKTQLDSIIQAKMQENSSKVPVSNLAGEKK